MSPCSICCCSYVQAEIGKVRGQSGIQELPSVTDLRSAAIDPKPKNLNFSTAGMRILHPVAKAH